MGWNFWDEVEGRLRGIVRRAKPRSIDDRGPTQTATVTVMNSEGRSNVEVLQPYGFASVPAGGSLMVVLAVGGDQGDLVGLPVAAPGARMGGLRPGEAAVYGSAGQRVLCRADGSIEVISAKKVYLSGEPMQVESVEAVSIKAPKVRIEGEIWLMGDVHVAGDLTIGGTSTQAPPPGGDPDAPAR